MSNPTEKPNFLDVKKIREKVEARKKEFEETQKINGADSDFVRECLKCMELGDGILYAEIHGGKFFYNKTSSQWYQWAGHHWQMDELDRSLSSVEAVSEVYLKEAGVLFQEISKNLDDATKSRPLQSMQDAMFTRVRKLRTESGRHNCLKFANTNPVNGLSVENALMDQNPWLLACKNGVIDLRNGSIRSGKADDYLTKASPTEWKGIDFPAPAWEKALTEIFDSEAELIAYLNRLFGYGITGLSTEHVLPIFWGQGRNGKSTIVEIIIDVLGPLASPIQSELLLDQGRPKSSAGPSPDIMGLRGLRLAFASESDEGRRFSPSKVKWLSGGDTLVGRNPHDKYETKFKPSHTLILLTNHKPHAPSNDFAFWERVHLIPYKISFVDRKPQADNERPVDKNLKAKLAAEASGILAWLVRGCLKWQEQGLGPPPEVIEETQRYRRDEDMLADFIEECCLVDPEAETGSSELYDSFKEWFQENISKKNVLSHRKFGKLMVEKFERIKSGVYKYRGVKILDES